MAGLAEMAGGKYLLAGLAWVAGLAFDNTARAGGAGWGGLQGRM